MDYLNSLFSYQGKEIIITGGCGTLGQQIALAYAKAGGKVILWGRGSSVHPKETAEKLAQSNGLKESFVGIKVDTSNEANTEKALAQSLQISGKIDLLVNGVGGNMGKSSLLETDMDTFRKVLNINLIAGFMIPSQKMVGHWKKEGFKGSIINIASLAGHKALSRIWAYNAAKSAVLSLTQQAAKELAADGIRVNAISPGFFVAKQNKALLIADDTKGTLTERGQSIINRTPMGRFGDAAELEAAFLYLGSEKAAGFVTGTTLVVDGGFLADNI